MEQIVLNDGNRIPAIGYGVYLIPNDGSTYKAVSTALAAGYRLIDTATAYFNEEEVGKAILDSSLPRDEVFVTSKLWLSRRASGYSMARAAIERTLKNMQLDTIDLYLIHQPYGDVPGAWKAMEEAKEEGLLKSIGVSNMTPALWKQFVPQFSIKPAVNQIQFNPLVQQKEIRALMEKDKVKTEAWYPLGHGDAALLSNPLITALAAKYGKNAGQICLRFEVQEGVIPLPKSTNPERIRTNLDVFDFVLTSSEMDALRALDAGNTSRTTYVEGNAGWLKGSAVPES